MAKLRIDKLLIERELIETLDQAQRLIMAGQVRAQGQVVLNPSDSFAGDIQIDIDWGPRYVSRGGEKLAAALDEFNVEINGLICADIGASTGGFTDCLIQNGARRVYAIDVGRGILHWKLRQNPKIVLMEGSNARIMDQLPESIDLITLDVSFISSKMIFPVVRSWFKDESGRLIVLIKPQFEATKTQASRGKGVITDPAIHKQVLSDVLQSAITEGFQIAGLMQSPIMGPKGNKEFLAELALPAQNNVDLDRMIEAMFPSNNIAKS
jgi:23S rRNA (cytidine1920-2'-O)/16S rRNA (cytidine1409-2'-O)-methyltransferase